MYKQQFLTESVKSLGGGNPHIKVTGMLVVACKNIRFSSLFACGDVSCERARRNGCFRRLCSLKN